MLVDTRPVEGSDFARVPFGRNRALALVGGVLFSAALQLTAPKLARAGHGADPYPCAGFGACHCCSGSTCCEGGCSWPGGSHTHCSSGTQCWYVCSSENDLYKCCDWHSTEQTRNDNGHCICREFINPGGPCP